jgi:hypothetical protein
MHFQPWGRSYGSVIKRLIEMDCTGITKTVSRGWGGLFRHDQRRQFSRSGYASTLACGSEVGVFEAELAAGLKPCPSDPCLNKLFAQFDFTSRAV